MRYYREYNQSEYNIVNTLSDFKAKVLDLVAFRLLFKLLLKKTGLRWNTNMLYYIFLILSIKNKVMILKLLKYIFSSGCIRTNVSK